MDNDFVERYTNGIYKRPGTKFVKECGADFVELIKHEERIYAVTLVSGWPVSIEDLTELVRKMDNKKSNWVTWADFKRSEFEAIPKFLRCQCYFCKFMFDQRPPDDSGTVYHACKNCREDPELNIVIEPYNKDK